jgi:hypothetical protein
MNKGIKEERHGQTLNTQMRICRDSTKNRDMINIQQKLLRKGNQKIKEKKTKSSVMPAL